MRYAALPILMESLIDNVTVIDKVNIVCLLYINSFIDYFRLFVW